MIPASERTTTVLVFEGTCEDIPQQLLHSATLAAERAGKFWKLIKCMRPSALGPGLSRESLIDELREEFDRGIPHEDRPLEATPDDRLLELYDSTIECLRGNPSDRIAKARIAEVRRELLSRLSERQGVENLNEDLLAEGP